MKISQIVVLLVAFAFVGAVFSTLVTTIAWSIQIEPRAFQCNDSCGWPFDNYWTSMDDHRRAGDKISTGWTWEQLEGIRWIYIAVFLLLWITPIFIPFRMIKRHKNPQ